MTGVPTKPLRLIPTGGVTVKFVELQPVLGETVTQIGPAPAPAGAWAVICVSESTLKVESDIPLNVTDVAPVKFTPLTVTGVPGGPDPGLNPVTCGG